MKISISDRDKSRADRIKFICEKVLLAMDLKAEFVMISDIAEMKELLKDNCAIIIYNEDNDVISAEDLVDLVIMNGSKAILLAMAETKQKLFRFLPANPYALISTGSYEKDIILQLSNAIEHLIHNA